jgi:hypothetical protein
MSASTHPTAAAGAVPSHQRTCTLLSVNLATGRKQRQLAVPLASFIEGFDQLAPGLALTVIDLAEIKHLPLDHLPPAQRLLSTIFQGDALCRL